ncbi:hypothetical protein [Daejeonella sp.]|uniref:hypothetical protein n=1 Tax=Daejeonella sp. TaxID=2805397 RepID=UPI0025C17845|nr:hypothetical protein [Daejeonella sp.]
MSKKDTKEISVFLLKVELTYKTVAQVSYKDEHGNVKIVRFFDNTWSREVLSFSDDFEDLSFKFFAHSPNLVKDERVKLTISLKGEIHLSQEFIVDKDKDFTGWLSVQCDMKQ